MTTTPHHIAIDVNSELTDDVLLDALMALDTAREMCASAGAIRWNSESEDIVHAMATRQLAQWLLSANKYGAVARRITARDARQHAYLRDFWFDCVNAIPGIRRIDVAVERLQSGVIKAHIAFIKRT
jgi:hypothetical protein